MALVIRRNQPWGRKHDHPAVPRVPNAARLVFPRSLEEVIEICRTRAPEERIHAAGSHWALSDAARSDHVFVETHDPNEVQQALGRQLFDVVPPCLDPRLVDALARSEVPPFDRNTVGGGDAFYPVHVEAGKRIFQLYAELDEGDSDPRSLAQLLAERGNPDYLGPWALRTLGSAGGQTIVGALTTGTHGGDFTLPPLADDVLALHLVADGGKHFWIEPPRLEGPELPLTADAPLRALYGHERFGGPGSFEIVRDEEMFRAVLVSLGRFGIIYSVVLRAVPQYSLHQERRLTVWQNVKGLIADFAGPLYTGHDQERSPITPNRFLQIGISVAPFANGTLHLAGVTRRWNVPLAPRPGSGEPAGRRERRGDVVDVFRPRIQAPLFRNAGEGLAYTSDALRPELALAPSFLERASADAGFVDGILDVVIAELDDFVASKGAQVGAILGAVAGAGGAPGVGLVLSLVGALGVLRGSLRLLQAYLRGSSLRFGPTLGRIRDGLLSGEDPDERTAGLLVWQMISFAVFRHLQADSDFDAISYAVMDAHDYRGRGGEANVESIEVFFDAADPMLVAYVDALLAFERTQQAQLARAFVGSISLRFTGRTRALLGEQQFERSCAVEVAGLRDVAGVTELIEYASALALDANVLGILHWGQRNESRRAQIEDRFGDAPETPGGPLHLWRRALARITDNGRLDGFSSAFTRRAGLEIVRPLIESLSVKGSRIGVPITIEWDCSRNPPSTEVGLVVTAAATGQRVQLAKLPRAGVQQLDAQASGRHIVTLSAAIELEGERICVERTAIVELAAGGGAL